MGGAPKLRLEQVRKSFAGRKVCDGIDLSVHEGEMVCLIGPSGSGKSTLLRCINLLESVDDGRIFLDGDEISAPGLNALPVRRRIGLVFQNYNLFPHMTAAENVMLAPRRIHRLRRQELRPRIVELFRRFGLEDHMDNYPDQLSGGQQQRVAIARALAMDPEIMLFDEITSALDPELVGEVLDVLRQLRTQGMTMVFATHEMNFARQAADKICFIDVGRIVEEGPPSKLFSVPSQPRTRAFLKNYLIGSPQPG